MMGMIRIVAVQHTAWIVFQVTLILVRMKMYRIKMTGDFKFDVMIQRKFLIFTYWMFVKHFNLYRQAENYLKEIGVKEWKSE